MDRGKIKVDPAGRFVPLIGAVSRRALDRGISRPEANCLAEIPGPLAKHDKRRRTRAECGRKAMGQWVREGPRVGLPFQ